MRCGVKKIYMTFCYVLIEQEAAEKKQQQQRRKRRSKRASKLNQDQPELAGSVAMAATAQAHMDVSSECVLCLDQVKEWALFPCMHVQLCSTCVRNFKVFDDVSAQPLLACPTCRTALQHPFVMRADKVQEISSTLATAKLWL